MSDDPVRLHAEERITAEVALARLILGGASPDDLPARIAASGNLHLACAAQAHAERLRRLRAMMDHASVDHACAGTGRAALARVRAMFDRAVTVSPEASVAAYTLGDAHALGEATAEIVDWLDGEGLLSAKTDALDFGCGIGRVAAALGPRVRSVLGLDLSPAMIETARRMNAGRNVRYETTDGADLAALAKASFDLVLAVDSFPYVVQAGTLCANTHIAEFARVLRPGGALAILNLSYRTPAADGADAARWASSHRWRLTQAGGTPFRLWDGSAYLWRRDAG